MSCSDLGIKNRIQIELRFVFKKACKLFFLKNLLNRRHEKNNMNMCETQTTTKFDVQKLHDAEEKSEIFIDQDAKENTQQENIAGENKAEENVAEENIAEEIAMQADSEIEPKHFFQQIQSQYEAYAFASMIMASLPFPPLPLVVNYGEDMEDGMASSFDLTQQAIMADQANVYTTKDNDVKIMQKKIQILKNLHSNMKEHFQNAVCTARDNHQSIAQCTNTDDWIEKAYNIYTTNLRKYLLECYPNCTSDMRFFPIRDVPADHVVMGHAKSHVQSMLLQENNFENLNADSICSNLNTYSDVIHYYACDLGSLPES